MNATQAAMDAAKGWRELYEQVAEEAKIAEENPGAARKIRNWNRLGSLKT